MKKMSDELRKQIEQALVHKSAVEGGNVRLVKEVEKKAKKAGVELKVEE